MRGKYYSAQLKGTAVLLVHIAILLVFLSSLFYLRALDNSSAWLEEENSSDYLESETYKNQVLNEVASLMTYLSGKCKFETNGLYDPDRIVDIADYVKKDIITGEITHGIGYYLKDLLAWEQEGIEYYSVDQVSDTPPLKEIYAPIGYSSILEYASMTGVSAADYYYYLSCTVEAIWSDVWQYNQYKNHFPGDRTNLKYLVLDENDKTVFSNTDLSEEEVLNLGTYVVMDFRDLSVESDLAAITNDLFAFLSSIPYQMQECRLVVGIDTNFPIQDEFYEYGRQYVDYWNTVTVSLILGIIGIVIVLVLVSYLTVTTGKIDLNSRIYAKDFDRIPVEAIVLMIAGEIALIGYSMMRLLNTLYLNAVLVGSYSVLIIFANMIGLSAYLSLVRRVRTRNVWKRSVILRLTAGIRKCILNRKITVRIVLYYLSLLILNIGCCFFLNQLEWIVLIAFDLGFLYFLLREGVQRSQINEGIEQLKNGDIHYQFDLEKFHGSNRDMAENLNLIGSGIQKTVAENLKSERLKTDLITNVSHDIKTPLTSIINYIDLLKRQNVQDEKAVEYLKILENKSQRLKHLTEDLLEASKISSGNIKLEYMKLNFKELLLQTNGEFSEKFETKGLELVVRVPDGPVFIWADGRRIWRIVENLYNNVFKYAMPNTRVYVDIKVENERMEFSIKNISEQALNIEASELTERFIRGDISRSTEGSGLGLSIAKNLTELQNGEFSIYLDGDLFKVTVVFPLAKQENRAPGIALMEDDSEPETADFEESPEKQEEEPKKESILTRLGRKKTGTTVEIKEKKTEKPHEDPS